MSTAADTTHYWPIIAVVDGYNPTAVWHVDTDPEAKRGYLTGAWLIGEADADAEATGRTNDPLSWAGHKLAVDALQPLVDGLAVVATTSGRQALRAAGVDCDIVDHDATEAAIVQQLEAYREAVKQENKARRERSAAGGAKEPALRLPQLPDRIDLAPAQTAPAGGEAAADMALKWAHGVADFVATWNDVDRVRRQRAKGFLTKEWGADPLSPPLVTQKMSTLEV